MRSLMSPRKGVRNWRFIHQRKAFKCLLMELGAFAGSHSVVCLVLCLPFVSGQYKDHHCPNAREGDLRLRGTKLHNAGRVEICHDNVWGVVCAHNWQREEAKVVCRQLGYSVHEGTYVQLSPEDLTVWERGKNYTRPDWRTKRWLGYVYCHGDERFLEDCSYGSDRSSRKQRNNFGRVACHSADRRSAGVVCKGIRSNPDANNATTTSAHPALPKSSLKPPTVAISQATRRSKISNPKTTKPEASQRTSSLKAINERQRPKYCPAVFGCAHYNPPSENDCCQTCNQTISVCPGIECPPVDRCARYEEEARPGECCLRCIRQKGNTKGLSKGRFCSNVVCPVGQICTVKNDHPMCTCRTKACRRQPGQSEVCGTDGRTYLSSCDLRQSLCRSCRAGTVAIKYERACSAPSE